MKSYMRKLSASLVERHGKRRYYSSQQVQQASFDCGDYDTDFLFYAYASFIKPSEFDQISREDGASWSYIDLRSQIGELLFNGKIDFTILDALYTLHTLKEGISDTAQTLLDASFDTLSSEGGDTGDVGGVGGGTSD
jgi:hypothetical protein